MQLGLLQMHIISTKFKNKEEHNITSRDKQKPNQPHKISFKDLVQNSTLLEPVEEQIFMILKGKLKIIGNETDKKKKMGYQKKKWKRQRRNSHKPYKMIQCGTPKHERKIQRENWLAIGSEQNLNKYRKSEQETKNFFVTGIMVWSCVCM